MGFVAGSLKAIKKVVAPKQKRQRRRRIKKSDIPLAQGEFPRDKRPAASGGGRRGMGEPTTGAGPLFREDGTSVHRKSRKGENPSLLAGGDSEQKRAWERELKREDLEEGQYPGRWQAEKDISRGTLKESPRRDLTDSIAVRKSKESHKGAIKEREKWLAELDKLTPKNMIFKSKRDVQTYKNLVSKLKWNKRKIREIEKKAGTVVKKYEGKKGGGQVMTKKNRMSRVGLSPAEEARSGTQSEAKRRRYAKGGGVTRAAKTVVSPKALLRNLRGAMKMSEVKRSKKSPKVSAQDGGRVPSMREMNEILKRFRDQERSGQSQEDLYRDVDDVVTEARKPPIPKMRRIRSARTPQKAHELIKSVKRPLRRKKGGKLKQGYDAREDEQLGMTRGPEHDKDMSEVARRKVARATRKPRGTYGFKKGGGIGIGMGQALRGGGAVRKS